MSIIREKNFLEDSSWPPVWPGKLKFDPLTTTTPQLFKILDKEETFHIGQCYEIEAAKLVECSVCGGHDFNVGKGGYYTAIRCINCEWETCVHEG